mmetsp:Transcript_52925/g.97681  ORF Transcript_52925/g.97681 Transcript_52925/m.97681 type:complete len:795 (+) Transcript_52925:89-2473(+)
MSVFIPRQPKTLCLLLHAPWLSWLLAAWIIVHLGHTASVSQSRRTGISIEAYAAGRARQLRRASSQDSIAVGPAQGSCWDNSPRHFEELTCELALRNSINGTLFLTFTNEAYLSMAVTWAANLRRAIGVNKMLVGAASEETYKHLQQADIPAFRMHSAMGTDMLGWGSAEFREMGRDKVKLALQLMEMNGPTVVLTDSDVIWMQNPLFYFGRYWRADLLVSVDNAGTDRLVKVDLHNFTLAPHAYSLTNRTALLNSAPLPTVNIGIMVLRPGSMEVNSLVRRWFAQVKGSDRWDQEVLDHMLKGRMSMSDIPNLLNTNLTEDAEGPEEILHWGMLPGSQFSGGEDFFAARLFERLNVPVYAVHTDFTNWGLYGKRAKLRALGVWEDDLDYFQGKFLTLDLLIPDALLVPYSDIDVNHEAPERHIQLVNYQLKQIAYAAAIAQGLNRTLVLPEIRCTCEFFWAPIHTRQCRFPEWSEKVVVPTEMPYICPPDQIFNMEVLDQRFPHRQANFLTDGRWRHRNASDAVKVMSKSSRSITGEVKIYKAKTPKTYAQAATVEIAHAQKMRELRETLEPFRDTTVMVLGAGVAETVFGGFDNFADLENFRDAADGTTGQWCCSDANLVQGGVKYKDLGEDYPGWPAFAGNQPERCKPRHLEKHNNSKGMKIPDDTSPWWGAKYPEVAAQQCFLIGDAGRCANSTHGLCECPAGGWWSTHSCTDAVEALIQDDSLDKPQGNLSMLLERQLNGLSREQLAHRFQAWSKPHDKDKADHASVSISPTGRAAHDVREKLMRRAPE